MFEKEAIIHAFEATIGIECLNKPIEDFTYEELSDEQQEKAYDFKKGAEFGYNKANEWHYVKDGEYPTNSNRVLVLTDEGVGFGIYGLDNKKWYTYDTGFDVIAWKEITLPALPNEVKEDD